MKWLKTISGKRIKCTISIFTVYLPNKNKFKFVKMFFWKFGWLNKWKNCQTPYGEWQKLKFCVHPLLLFFHHLHWIICEDISDLRLKVSQKEWHVKLKTDDWKWDNRGSDTTLCWLFFIQASKMFSFVDDIFFTKPKKNFELDSAKFTKIRCWVWLFQQSKKWTNLEECHPSFFFWLWFLNVIWWLASNKKARKTKKWTALCEQFHIFFCKVKSRKWALFMVFLKSTKKLVFLHFRLDCWVVLFQVNICCFSAFVSSLVVVLFVFHLKAILKKIKWQKPKLDRCEIVEKKQRIFE